MNRFIKGIIVGIGKIIPGVSGSILAISLGIYEESIKAINNLLKYPRDSIKYLFPIGVGIVVSIIFFSKIIICLLNIFYVPTILFFLGLILGSVKDILKEIKVKYIPFTFICFVLIVLLCKSSDNQLFISNNYLYIYMIFIGLIDAATMVIPGVSGTAVLMMLGCYNMLIEVISDLTNVNHLIYNFSIIIPFLVGMIIGIFLFVKIIQILLTKYSSQTYSAILGLLIASCLFLFKSTLNTDYTTLEVIIGLLLLLTGFEITKRIN